MQVMTYSASGVVLTPNHDRSGLGKHIRKPLEIDIDLLGA